ncbi:phage holin family protein [Microbispora bryophytorum]|uniref:Membrane protein n=1 Tax=Microbispora bryophytorum TaxID=1460882 RepID=A0A8H9GZL6_9ACTN|nr:phage holin family protein [Microbispora bryophytorum]MBD3136964.1 phage holin family protein [Microbispora bryophytorum]TQS07230.1 phage holin family protein [Microbispora bryophytorum]GGO13814.1 membrane protein [Microbispora bryophytorum]
MTIQKESPSTGELVRRLSEDVSRLIRDELRLARLEMTRKGKRAGMGAGLLGAAGLIAFYGGGALVATAILALALVLPAWASALIIGAALLALAGLLALVGKEQVSRAAPPTPDEAMRSLKADIDVMKESARR